jgi:RNA polymerase sigma-70 factor, ECF subfamily
MTSATFATAVQAHSPALRARARRLCGSVADAEDLVQDTLERGLHHFGTLVPGSDVRCWLLTVMHNLFIDVCRRRARRPREAPLADREPPAPTPTDEPPPAWADITEEQVRAAVARLDADFRRVYLMFVVERRSYQEIAGALAIPRATVGTRLMRARRQLRELLLARVN